MRWVYEALSQANCVPTSGRQSCVERNLASSFESLQVRSDIGGQHHDKSELYYLFVAIIQLSENMLHVTAIFEHLDWKWTFLSERWLELNGTAG